MDDPRVTPTGPALWQFTTDGGVARLCALESVPVERAALDELSRVLELNSTLDSLGRAGWGDAALESVVCTPDLHKGAGIPIGTVVATRGAIIPAAIGGDVNCGMRLCALDVEARELDGQGERLTGALRRRFFEGARNLPSTASAREALLVGGLEAFFEVLAELGWPGTWALAQGVADQILTRRSAASLRAGSVSAGMADWVRGSGVGDELTFDQHLGTVGGGNHFCEIDRVAEICDRQAAYGWGLEHGAVTIMAHTGSLWMGHIVARKGREQAEREWPDGLARPANGLLVIRGDRAGAWLAYQSAGANFALANRLALVLMAADAISEVVEREVALNVVYDGAHNLCWELGEDRFVHRKGATSAGGIEDRRERWWGEPVIVPGSMGASSWVCAGHGNGTMLESACHGAGRAVPRREGRRDDQALDAFLSKFNIVTPIDASSARADVLDGWRAEIAAEAPWVYKDITPVIGSLEAADVAHGVVRLEPMATVKA